MPYSDAYKPPQSNLAREAVDSSSAELVGILPPPIRVGLFAGVWIMWSLWFAYDGWLNQDPEMAEHKLFNQIMFGIVTALSLLLLRSVWRVATATRERRSNSSALVLFSPATNELRIATMPWLWAILFSGLSLLFHKKGALGVLCFVGSFFSANLVGLGLAFFIRRILVGAYEEEGWVVL